MLAKEYKILKYVYRRKEVTASALTKKFLDIDLYWERIRKNLDIQPAKLVYSISYLEKKNIPEDEEIISLNLNGEEVVEKKRHDFWGFVLPYGITTIIAISSVAIQFIKLIHE